MAPGRLGTMKVTIVTPLYPPDIASPAPHVKELATRLAAHHSITVLAYGSYPEQVPGVTIIAVSKRQPKLLRILAFTLALFKTAWSAEVLLIENGPSVELPAGIVLRVLRRRTIVHVGDDGALQRTGTSKFSAFTHHFLLSRAYKVLTKGPLDRPEILPFEPYPDAKFKAYEESWEEHLATLDSLFV